MVTVQHMPRLFNGAANKRALVRSPLMRSGAEVVAAWRGTAPG